MSSSLKSQFKKLRFKNKITQGEFDCLMKKLEGHDERLVERGSVSEARWIQYSDADTYNCSNCTFGMFMNQYLFLKDKCIQSGTQPYIFLQYCPNCGAKMQNGQKLLKIENFIKEDLNHED